MRRNISPAGSQPGRWNIYSDHKQAAGTFALNDTDDLQKIAHDAPGASFTLWLASVSPGETKRVTLAVTALQSSLGQTDHPDIRAWVTKVEGYYAKSGFSDAPSLNKDGYQTQNSGDVRAYAQADVLDKETCDGVDNDCDGETDEDCTIQPDAGGVATPDADPAMPDSGMGSVDSVVRVASLDGGCALGDGIGDRGAGAGPAVAGPGAGAMDCSSLSTT